MFRRFDGNWKLLRNHDNLVERDFHPESFSSSSLSSYEEKMSEVYEIALDELRSAQAHGQDFVLFTHGSSTSRRGNTTARSQVRKLMRSKDSTPFVLKSHSTQGINAFLAKIRKV